MVLMYWVQITFQVLSSDLIRDTMHGKFLVGGNFGKPYR